MYSVIFDIKGKYQRTSNFPCKKGMRERRELIIFVKNAIFLRKKKNREIVNFSLAWGSERYFLMSVRFSKKVFLIKKAFSYHNRPIKNPKFIFFTKIAKNKDIAHFSHS